HIADLAGQIPVGHVNHDAVEEVTVERGDARGGDVVTERRQHLRGWSLDRLPTDDRADRHDRRRQASKLRADIAALARDPEDRVDADERVGRADDDRTGSSKRALDFRRYRRLLDPGEADAAHVVGVAAAHEVLLEVKL